MIWHHSIYYLWWH